MTTNPSKVSSLETECLFGETVEVLDKHFNWVYCKLETDNYFGWIKKNNLGKSIKTSHRVISPRSFIYKTKNLKSEIIMYLPMGSQLVVDKIKLDWAKINFFYRKTLQVGYVPSNHIVEINTKCLDWVKSAQLLEGTPYKWGGRDTIGIDCSALLQLSYQTYGESIPRNTSDQIKLNKPKVNQIDKLCRGCVIFWDGHVGIMVDRLNCIHANAYHMKTITEPLVNIFNRMGKEYQILKIMNFN